MSGVAKGLARVTNVGSILLIAVMGGLGTAAMWISAVFSLFGLGIKEPWIYATFCGLFFGICLVGAILSLIVMCVIPKPQEAAGTTGQTFVATHEQNRRAMKFYSLGVLAMGLSFVVFMVVAVGIGSEAGEGASCAARSKILSDHEVLGRIVHILKGQDALTALDNAGHPCPGYTDPAIVMNCFAELVQTSFIFQWRFDAWVQQHQAYAMSCRDIYRAALIVFLVAGMFVLEKVAVFFRGASPYIQKNIKGGMIAAAGAQKRAPIATQRFDFAKAN